MFTLILLFALLSYQTTRADEGKRIYTTTCIKCHNTNPNQKGPIGPDLVSTPKEVFLTKISTGKYPASYKPKRKTRAMPVFRNLKGKEELLYKYIQTFKGKN